MKKKHIHTGLSLTAIILSIIAICIAYTHTKSLSWDIAGTLVGILSMLVTVLIGWQIYNYISFEKKAQTIIKNELNKLEDKFLTSMVGSMLLTNERILKYYVNQHDWKIAVHLLNYILEDTKTLMSDKESIKKYNQKIDSILRNALGILQNKEATDFLDKKTKEEMISNLKPFVPINDKAYELIKILDIDGPI